MDLEKTILDLQTITQLRRGLVIEKLETFKTRPLVVKQFYLACCRFPDKKEDLFMSKYGFEAWYLAFKLYN